MARPWLLLVFLVAACEVAPRRATGSACRLDTDCTITSFRGCCPSCDCPKPPHAISNEELRAQLQKCSTTSCEKLTCAEPKCPPQKGPAQRAICNRGTCEAVGPGKLVECQRNADCALIEEPPPPGECACPGANMVAVPLEKVPRLEKGAAPPPPPKRCDVCRPVPAMDARCADKRCVRVWRTPPG